jgi:hypothetical protein
MTPTMRKGRTPVQRAAPNKNASRLNYAVTSEKDEATSESFNTSNTFVSLAVETLDPNIGVNVFALGDQGLIALRFCTKNGTQVFNTGLTPHSANHLATYLVGALHFVQTCTGKKGKR